MISVLRGTVVMLDSASAVIDVNGIGLKVLATPNNLSTLRVGAEATLYTALVVREDSLTLFGFADADERDTFDILQSVSGIGPRTALAVLAVHTPDLLRQAVQNQDAAALQRVSGIGKKGAQRMILELGSKLGPARGTTTEASSQVGDGTVVEALIGLGWSEQEAQFGFSEACAAQPEGDTATLLRASLQVLGQRR